MIEISVCVSRRAQFRFSNPHQFAFILKCLLLLWDPLEMPPFGFPCVALPSALRADALELPTALDLLGQVKIIAPRQR